MLKQDHQTVMQIIPQLNTGGAEKTVIEMTEAIVNAGWRAVVVSEGGSLVGQIKALGGSFIPFPANRKNPFSLWQNSRKLSKLITSHNVSLIHARSRAPAWSALWAARATGTPFVTTYHGAHSQKTALKRFYNSVMARGDVVIANSDYTAEQIRTHHPFAADRVRIIYRGIDCEAFDQGRVCEARKENLRQQWGLLAEDRVIFQPARLSSRKGQRDVINTVEILQQRGKLGAFIIIMAGGFKGNEIYVDQLRSMIDEKGLTEKIKLVGHCGDMPAGYALSDMVLAVSSKPESFGRGVAESLAMKRQVIVSDVGAQPETIHDNQGNRLSAARLVRPHDPGAIADAILEMVTQPRQERTEAVKEARGHIKAKYSKSKLQSETMDVYRSLIAAKTQHFHEI